MILQTQENIVSNTLGTDSVEFDIEKSAKLFDLLSNKIYSNPIRAIIRELSCNAIDAHLSIKNPNPIDVFLPTDEEPTLIIQDHGIGMTHEDVVTVYKTYGKSTKASSNDLIGALGLGGKTPLAYTNQFNLTTSCEGKKNSYLIFRNEEGIPEVSLLDTEDSDETGTSVEITIRERDIKDFYKNAFITFIFFDQIPNILRGEEHFYEGTFQFGTRYGEQKKSRKEIYNSLHEMILSEDKFYNANQSTAEDHLFHTIIQAYGTNYGIIMGQIFYTVNEEHLLDGAEFGEYSKKACMYPCISDYSYYKIFRVPLGSVSFQPSREALNYSLTTKKLLSELFFRDFNEWADGIINIPTEQDFINQMKTTKIGYLVPLQKWIKRNPGVEKVEKIVDKFERAIDFFFKSSELKNCFVCTPRKNSGAYLVQDFSQFAQIDIFQKIYDGSYKNLVEFNDPIHLEKLLSKWVERKQNRAYIGLSSFHAKYFEDLDYDSLLIVESAKSYFNKMTGIPTHKLTDLIVTYNKNNAQVKEKAERESTPRNTEGRCYNFKSHKMTTIQEFVELSKTEEITYEFFEGDYGSNGWYFEVDFNNIAAKKDTLRNTERLSWQDKRVPKMPYSSYTIELGANHFLVDYNFFKRNQLHIMNNVMYLKDWYLTKVADLFVKIDGEIKNPVFFEKHLPEYCRLNEKIFKVGIKKYGSAFEKTDFGIDYAALQNESSQIETDFIAMQNNIAFIMSMPIMKRYPHLNPSFNKLAEQLRATADSLQLRLKKAKMNYTPTELDEALKNKYYLYFMIGTMDYANLANNSKAAEKYADYIASLDGLKEINT